MNIRTILAVTLSVPLLLGAGSDGSSNSSSSSAADATQQRYFRKGVEAMEQGRFEEAIKWYRQALERKRDDPDSLNNLGFSLRSVGMAYLREADESYRKALAIDPDHVQALEYQGELYLWLGRLRDADGNLRRLKALGAEEADELGEELGRVLDEARGLL